MNHSSRGLLRNLVHLRHFHTTRVKLIDPKTVEEVRIPVPWGHIAGKLWGCKESPRAIAIHGILDNANTFDNLVPLIDIPSVLCIDLPGHGQSSHLPKGLHIQYIDYIAALRYIIKYYYKQENTTLIGHSYGSSVCTAYAAFFPEGVDKLVCIECSRLPTSTYIENTISDFRKSIEDFLSFEESERKQEGRTLEDRTNHLYKIRKRKEMPVSKESCRLILERATNTLADNLKVFSFDPRLQYRAFGRFSKPMCLSYAKLLTMDVLNISFKNGFYSMNPNFIYGFIPEEMDRSLRDIEKVSKRFVSKVVNGHHHALMDEPEMTAEIINDFLNYR